jgi:hypothetical protein
MGLSTWQGKVVRKQDIIIAKNYLTEDELDTLNRLVVIFLEAAELRVKSKNDIAMSFWQTNIDKILDFNDQPILKHKGKISHAQMQQKVKDIYQQFDQQRKVKSAQLADKLDQVELDELIALEKSLGDK